MELKEDDRCLQCPCCLACKYKTEFQKIFDLKEIGLVIYRHTMPTVVDENDFPRAMKMPPQNTEEIFILHNTKDVEITSKEFIPALTSHELSCPRCQHIKEHAQRLMLNIPAIDKNDIIGVCNHCRMKEKSQSICKCQEIAKIFTSDKTTQMRHDETKKRIQTWLRRIQHLSKEVASDEEDIQKTKIEVHSELKVDISEDPTLIRSKPRSTPSVDVILQDEAIKAKILGLQKLRPYTPHMTSKSSHVKDESIKEEILGLQNLKSYTPQNATQNDIVESKGIKLEILGLHQLKSNKPQKTIKRGMFEEEDIQLGLPKLKPYEPHKKRPRGLSQEAANILGLAVSKPMVAAQLMATDEDLKHFTKYKAQKVGVYEPRKPKGVHLKEKAEILGPKMGSTSSLALSYEEGEISGFKRHRPILSPSGTTKSDTDLSLLSKKQKSQQPRPDDVYSKKESEGKEEIETLESKRHRVKDLDRNPSDEVLKYGPQKIGKEGLHKLDVTESTETKKNKHKGTLSQTILSDEIVGKVSKKKSRVQTTEKEGSFRSELGDIFERKKRKAKSMALSGFSDEDDNKKTDTKTHKMTEKLSKTVLSDKISTVETKSKKQTKIGINLPETEEVTGILSKKKTPEQTKPSLAKSAHEIKKKSSKKPEHASVENLSKTISELTTRGIKSSKSARFNKIFFPKTAKEMPKVKPAESSKLIKDTQDKLQLKAEEEEKKKEAALQRKLEEEERKKNIREQKKKDEEEKRNREMKDELKMDTKYGDQIPQKSDISGKGKTTESHEDKKKSKKIKDEKSTEKQDTDKLVIQKQDQPIIQKDERKKDKRETDKLKDSPIKESDKLKETPIKEADKLKESPAKETDTAPKKKDEKPTVTDTEQAAQGLVKASERTKPSEDKSDKQKGIGKGKEESEVFERRKDEMTYVDKVLKKEDKAKDKNKKLKNAEDENLKKALEDADKKTKFDQGDEKVKSPKQKTAEKKKPERVETQTKDSKVVVVVVDTKGKESNQDLVSIKKIQQMKPSYDDLILKLVRMRREEGVREKKPPQISAPPSTILRRRIRKKSSISTVKFGIDSDMELDLESLLRKKAEAGESEEIIVGQKLYQKKKMPAEKIIEDEKPVLFKSIFKEASTDKAPQITFKEHEGAAHTPTKTLKGSKEVEESSKGVIRYALSDRTFIDKGWTMLPTEKVVRKMNVYRMRPARPEFDWFEHNKNKRLMSYDTGESLAEFGDNGRGRWYYRNGRLALDYYDSEDLNAQQRFVVYSSGEPDEHGRSHPVTVLAMFDYLGNGIVFDHAGKIRLKYNQTEGVVLDRGIGPVSHWKWHTLNDPPVLQQVMIDTHMAHKDPDIMNLGGPGDQKVHQDNEDMLAIEFDNFIKEKSKKSSQKFKPFQIKMKALKINEQFSLRVLDQATIYLIFRDGTTNMKLNIGMILDHKEIIDTDTAEVGEVSNNLERFPARTDSIAGLQQTVAHAQCVERARIERDRRLRPREPTASIDRLTAAASRPLRIPLMTVPSGSDAPCVCAYSRKPTSMNVYYDTRLI